MRMWSVFRSLLVILAVLGVVVGPFASPMAETAMAAATMSGMPDDMDCHHCERPAIPDCESPCLVMTVCVAKCFPSALIDTIPPSARWATGEPLWPANAGFGSPLYGVPPDRPPRT